MPRLMDIAEEMSWEPDHRDRRPHRVCLHKFRLGRTGGARPAVRRL